MVLTKAGRETPQCSAEQGCMVLTGNLLLCSQTSKSACMIQEFDDLSVDYQACEQIFSEFERQSVCFESEHIAMPRRRPAGLMVKASVSGSDLAEDSGFESQVGRECFSFAKCTEILYIEYERVNKILYVRARHRTHESVIPRIFPPWWTP